MRDLRTLQTAADHRILVLAPHPDDFEVVAATMRFFRDRGARIDLAVLTGSANGVEDSFCSPPTDEHKARLREAEQREGCRLFGLPDDCLEFLRLAEDEEGHPLENEENVAAVSRRFVEVAPTAVFLPHPEDTNAGHRRTYRMFAAVAEQTGAAVVAFLNEDPKTVEMQADVFLGFDDGTAEWKAALLRCHRSQQQRGLNVRGHGLDERILRMNRAAAERLAIGAPYAEVFSIECRGGAGLDL
jgi:LmbE family N-acetylglucosaminyl deacetylase